MIKIQIVFDQFDPPLVLDAENITGVSDNTVTFTNGIGKPLTVIELTNFEEEYLESIEQARMFYECDVFEDEEYDKMIAEEKNDGIPDDFDFGETDEMPF